MAGRSTYSSEMAKEIVKAGYRALTRQYHPDLGGSHDKMVELNATYEHMQKMLEGSMSFSSATNGAQPEYRWRRSYEPPPPPRPEPPRRRRRSHPWRS